MTWAPKLGSPVATAAMVKIQFTNLTDLLPQIQEFKENYTQITSNGHSRISEDITTFMFCSTLPPSYELTACSYSDNITNIANYKLQDFITCVLQEESRRQLGETQVPPSTSS